MTQDVSPDTTATSPSYRALRTWQVLEKTGLSRTQLYRLAKSGQFPPSHKISERIPAWNDAEVDAWLAARFKSEPEADSK